MALGVVYCRESWQVPPPRSGRQPDVRAPSWTESPTDLEIAEGRVLLTEVGLLKERGLTAEVVVADFVFKNIQPLKDRAYPTYLYSGVTDSTRVTNKMIPAVDLVSRLEMILRGKVSNIGAPVAYSAWNLPPSKSFFSFASNPPASDSGLGLRVRPSPEEVEALVASLGDLPNDERQVHFEMPRNPSDAEISAMLDMLAEDSYDSVPAETIAVATIPEPKKTLNAKKSDGARPKRLRPASHPTAPTEGKKKKKRRLRRVSCLNQDAALLFLLLKKYQWNFLLELITMGVTLLTLTPMGVTSMMLNPLDVILLQLIPMGVTLMMLIPMGAIRPELTPMGVLFVSLTRMRKKRRKSP
jgi:hypothetical protein